MGFGGDLNKNIEYYAHHRENTVRWFSLNKRTLPMAVTLGFVVPVITYYITKDVQIKEDRIKGKNTNKDSYL